MKILIFSDIHGDLRALERVVAQPADIYIAAGDLSNFAQRPRTLRRNSEAARRTPSGLAGKSRNARANEKILRKSSASWIFIARQKNSAAQTGPASAIATSRRSKLPANTPKPKSPRPFRTSRNGTTLSRRAFSAARHQTRRVRRRPARRKPHAARLGRTRKTSLSFLRTHPRNRRNDRSPGHNAMRQRRKRRLHNRSLKKSKFQAGKLNHSAAITNHTDESLITNHFFTTGYTTNCRRSPTPSLTVRTPCAPLNSR